MPVFLPLVISGMAVVGLFSLSADLTTAESGRKTLRIGKDWSLTANQHAKEMDGKRAKLLTSSGRVELKHGGNLVKGPWDVEAKAGKVECDFAAQKFILSGAPAVEQKDAKGVVVKSVQGEEGTTIEIDFTKPDAIRVNGQHKIKLLDAAAPIPAPAPAAK